MCDLIKKPFNPPRPTSSRRLKLWETERRFHCAILGTCLSLAELHKIIRQTGILQDPRPSDYDAHNALVGCASQECHAARHLTRFLDKKYRTPINQIAKADAKELTNYWQQALQSGNVAGPLWALATHPNTPTELLRQVFGDVHMLSHLAGASNRADLRRMTALEEMVTELRDTATRNKRQHVQQLAQKEAVIRQLEAELMRRLARDKSAADAGRTDQEEQLAASRQELSRVVRQLERTRRRLTTLTRRNEQLQQRLANMRTRLNRLESEQQASEMALQQLLTSDHAPEQPTANLSGRNIVYVGGHPSLSPHFRALVEKCHGRFEHHDGGVEESRANLHCLLSKADMVFCPVDCISHDACLKVKRFCKQNAKAFIPLRSSGLSAFAKELSQIHHNPN